MRRSARRFPFLVAVSFAALATACTQSVRGADLEAQREAFREAWAAGERGDWEPALRHRPLLEDYVLWPDLRAAWLAAKLGSVSDDEVREFLARWDYLRPARELRQRYALRLAADGRWNDYLDLYRRYYRKAGAARLDCLAVRAAVRTDAFDGEFAALARSLWLVGTSQVDECDPVFEYMRGAGLLDERLLRERFELAIAARQFSLARYLARSIDEEARREAERWIAAGERPEEFLAADADCRDTEAHRGQLLYALERVAWSDASRAHLLLGAAARKHDFLPAEAAKIARYIALSAAQQHRPEALKLLSNLPVDAVDERVRAWQVRAALLKHAWSEALAAIDAMPEAQRREPEWRYWRAVALDRDGNARAARPLFHDLARDRSWYGFLAADEIGADYAFEHAALPADEAKLEELARHPALVRARELFYAGLESRGRAEWNDAMAELAAADLAQAALLAHRWSWHSQAIATIADSGHFDDLEIRYPLAFEAEFLESAEAAAIRGSWAWAVARSESLFMADVRSHAGAIGVMQLMPATARRAATKLGLPWAGLATLTDPKANIRLGTSYLAEMLERFDGNVVLATAAYNAGPHKVDEWLPKTEHALDARIWIENIPYDETRAFVRRVLVAEAIFRWRLTGEATRLTAELRDVPPVPERFSRAGPDGLAGAD